MEKAEYKKIVFITPTMEGGGSERVMATLSNGLAEIPGFQVMIALTRAERSVYKLNRKVKLEKNPYSYSVPGQIRFIHRIMKKNQEAVFVSFLTYQNMYTLIAGLGQKQRIIVSERNDPATMLDGRNYLVGLRAALYKKAACVVFQTEGARDYFDEKIRKKGVIIPNPLREDLPERYIGPREKRFVAFSRLDPQKNIPMMIEAFNEFSLKHPDYKLSIYGKGAEEEKLRNMVKRKGLEEKIEFCGFSRRVHDEIIKAAGFLSSSDYEGISNSMLEAMAIGLPCICTDCPIGGTRMFIKDGWNGFMVKVGSASEMAQKMCMLAEDEKLSDTLSRNAAAIKERISVDIILRRWMDIL